MKTSNNQMKLLVVKGCIKIQINQDKISALQCNNIDFHYHTMPQQKKLHS